MDLDSDDNKKQVCKMQDDDFRLPSDDSSEDESENESEIDEECESELASVSEEEVAIKREGDVFDTCIKDCPIQIVFFFFIFYQVMAYMT